MSLVRIACLCALLTALVGATHITARVATWHRVPGGTLFALAEQRLAAAHAPETPVLLLIGDTGAASPELRANFRAMARESALLVLHAGDIAYRGPRLYGRFLAAAEDLPFPLFAVPGDHDRDPAHGGYQSWDDRFAGRDRVVEKDGLRIVLLDSARNTLSDQSLQFLEEALRRPAPPAPAPRWIVVLTHCPPYRPNAPTPRPLGKGHAIRDAAVAQRLLDLLRDARVTLLATGHIHRFEVGNREGVPMVVSGGGGKDVQPGEDFHYVRITLSDPPVIEPVVTTPGSGREPLAELLDGVIAESLATGDRTTVVLAALTTLLLACERDRRRRRAR
jgi:predicted phosphodiesterase